MKSLIVILVLIVSCNAINFRFLSRSLVKAKSNTYGCSATDQGVKCLNCTVLAYCNNNEVAEETINCLSPTSYCDPYMKECVTMETCSMAAPQNSELLCMRQGFFPHPSEANKFMYCKEKNPIEKAVQYDCPEGSNYDMFKKICTTGIVRAANFTANGLCKNQAFQTVVHPLDNSLYARCSVPPKAIIVKMCENKNNVMNPEKNECEFRCPNEGFFPHPTENTKYFACVKDKESYKMIERKCELATNFLPDKEFCM